MFNNEHRALIKGLQPFVAKEAWPKMMDWAKLEEILNFRPLLTHARVKATDDFPAIPIVKPAWVTDPATWPVSIFSEFVLKQQTVCLRDLSRLTKEVNQVCFELEGLFKRPTDMHLFMSLVVGHEGFKKHNDGNHNIIAPQEGVINVTVYGEDEELFSEEIVAGDFVFIPAGVYHKVESHTKRFSFSFCTGVEDDPLGFEDRAWVHLGE